MYLFILQKSNLKKSSKNSQCFGVNCEPLRPIKDLYAWKYIIPTTLVQLNWVQGRESTQYERLTIQVILVTIYALHVKLTRHHLYVALPYRLGIYVLLQVNTPHIYTTCGYNKAEQRRKPRWRSFNTTTTKSNAQYVYSGCCILASLHAKIGRIVLC